MVRVSTSQRERGSVGSRARTIHAAARGILSVGVLFGLLWACTRKPPREVVSAQPLIDSGSDASILDATKVSNDGQAGDVEVLNTCVLPNPSGCEGGAHYAKADGGGCIQCKPGEFANDGRCTQACGFVDELDASVTCPEGSLCGSSPVLMCYEMKMEGAPMYGFRPACYEREIPKCKVGSKVYRYACRKSCARNADCHSLSRAYCCNSAKVCVPECNGVKAEFTDVPPVRGACPDGYFEEIGESWPSDGGRPAITTCRLWADDPYGCGTAEGSLNTHMRGRMFCVPKEAALPE